MSASSASSAASKIVIVLPAYNAGRTLLRTLAEIPAEYSKNILLVDDCSSDDTVEVARKAGISVYQHEQNRGYGANQKTCYQHALARGADIVVMVHPDHQYDATIIPELLRPLLDHKCDAVFGSRMLGGRPLEGGMPWWKYTANILLTALANLAFRRYLSDIHSGFRAYSSTYLGTVRFEDNNDGFIFDTEIIAQGMACGLSFREVPIVTRYFPEASSIGLGRSIVYGFGILRVLACFMLHTAGILHFKQFEPKQGLPDSSPAPERSSS